MELYEIILIGIALSMDACALTIANCSTYKNSLTRQKEWAMPIAFAIFQGVMPLIGFFIGSLFSGVIGAIADFLTAIIFFTLSAKIIFDLVKDMKTEATSTNKSTKTAKFSFIILIVQAFATSIDALAVGVTLVNLTFSVFIAVGIIAVITFILVSLALAFGKSLGKWFGCYAEWFGAGILILLAIKSLIESII
ncbi:MAG: manganese efflux pump [Clostridia bacterium]|nr:manganese efflux pump [Clostridia bacterium]